MLYTPEQRRWPYLTTEEIKEIRDKTSSYPGMFEYAADWCNIERENQQHKDFMDNFKDLFGEAYEEKTAQTED